VIGQGHVTTVTHSDKTAIAAEYTTCRATSIEEKDGLLAQTQNLFKLTMQKAADNAGIAGM
jgi:hypothetical protein